MVILGTQYAGEMKKGIFSVMHYLMPKRGILSLHSGCNVGAGEDVSLFFGLSGARAAPHVARRDALPMDHMMPALMCHQIISRVLAGRHRSLVFALIPV